MRKGTADWALVLRSGLLMRAAHVSIQPGVLTVDTCTCKRAKLQEALPCCPQLPGEPVSSQFAMQQLPAFGVQAMPLKGAGT